jgi:polyhydroxyalkanoate synthesis regulator protein
MRSPHRVRICRNRRLYDSTSHRYVSFEGLLSLVDFGVNFILMDENNGADRTNEFLLRLLCRRDGVMPSSTPVLTDEFLRDLLRLEAIIDIQRCAHSSILIFIG